MAEVETLGIFQDIEALVSDKLQVVSYKWLSRNYMVSSNTAKRLLQEFVEKHDCGLQVVYSLSGWLKNDPSNYHIRLVSGAKLAEAKKNFDGNISIQVYSVQACIPKDAATLWNTEFVQAEELFKEPFTVDNCLRDNRFCGISNSFVKRKVEGIPVTIASPQSKSAGGVGIAKGDSRHQDVTIPQPQDSKVQKSIAPQSPTVKEIKGESSGTGFRHQTSKPPSDRENFHSLPDNRKKVQNDKNSNATGSLLANMWGRASVKAKPSCIQEEAKNVCLNPTVTNAEAQILARETVDSVSSDEDDQNVFKRVSNGEGSRKRRVVFYFSDDEYEDAVNLASPVTAELNYEDPKESKEPFVSEKALLNSDRRMDDKPKFKQYIAIDRESNQPSKEESSVVTKDSFRRSSTEKIHSCLHETDMNKKDKPTNAASTSPKRKKVLKTRIDERGREVTEVIWEGEETEVKKDDLSMAKKANNNTVNNVANRPPAAKKSPALGNNAPSNTTVKAGTKKSGNSHDPKQGNIFSFFKRV